MRRMQERYLLGGAVFLAILLVSGVSGFMILEHETFLDALLTTVSAISTVGYSPPHPMSAAGKILAVGLILGGLVAIALVISVLTEYFMEGHLHGAWERTRMERAIAKLQDHFIICGFGRVGREVSRQLVKDGMDFVVLDDNEAPIEAARAAGYLYCHGDPSHDGVLQSVGVEKARGLIACADSDVANVYVTLTARSLNPDLFIVARAAYEDAEPKMYNAGANRVVSPYIMAGQHIAQVAAHPRVADYLSLLFDGRQIGVRILEIRVEDIPGLAGKPIKDVHHTLLQGAFVLAIDRGQERIEDVGPEEVIRPEDHLLVVGSGVELQKLGTIG